jgi:hypothetical protein
MTAEITEDTKQASTRAHAIMLALVQDGATPGQLTKALTYALCMIIATTDFKGGKDEVVSAIKEALDQAASLDEEEQGK